MQSKRDPILTIAEVCDELKSSKHTIIRFIKAGTIRAFRVGTQWRVRQSALDEYVATQEGEHSNEEADSTVAMRMRLHAVNGRHR